MGGSSWVNGGQEMGKPDPQADLASRLTFDISVIALGYEEEFGKYRRVVQHAL